MTKPKKIPDNAVTLREIEDTAPCSTEYVAFLLDIHGAPAGTYYTEYYNACVTDRNAHRPTPQKGLRKAKPPRYGPDDPIPLLEILRTQAPKGRYSGRDRVAWLVGHINRLGMWQDRLVEERRRMEVTVWEKILADGYKPQPKKRAR